ncbi:hypothetical protein V5O48_010348 [Marasmius crinis-equi]|uniref:F-box domain-containing protein n=1 Tax=Marasmius crinis-equi TaxID=585013 RepID=A0ABR3F8M5_9AGAR
MQGRKEGLKAWLDRSGSLPLTISLSTGVAPNTSTPGIDQGYADIIELLVRYSPRWKTIALGPRIASLNLQPLERLKAEDLPLLQAVHSSTNLFAFPSNPISPPSPTPLANLLTHAPSLRSLHLACELVPSVDLPLRWSRLTELRINSLTSYASVTIEPSQLVQKLAETCHSLIKLSIRASLPFPPHVFSTPAEPLDWESLREFEIMFEGYCYEFSNGGTQTRFSTGIRNTFKAFTAPNLRHLSFHIISLSNTGSAEVPPGLNEEGAPFEEFISRSRCMLTVLDVSLPRSLNVEAVSKSLRLLPSLKSLKLGHPVRRNSPAPDLQTLQVLREWIKAVFHALLLPDMCEDLEELECEGCYADADAAGLMVDLAFARQRLKAFKADFGTVSRGGVDILVSCLNAKVRELRETRKVQVDWTWQEEAPPKEAVKETPESGLPGTNEWW